MVDLCIEGQLLQDGEWIDDGVIHVTDGLVSWRGPRSGAPAVEARATIRHAAGPVVPGFVDLHVHGAGGADAVDGTAASLQIICRAHAAHGTTALCPTLLASPPEVLLRALETIRQLRTAHTGGARVIGAHLEGPFLNPARAGAQPVDHLRAPDPVLMQELLDAAGESLKIVTLAPELDGALALIEALVDRGVVVALGHSDATYTQARAAIDAGARLATHTFNAMRGLHHREPGLVGAVLERRDVTAEVIADGVHVAAPVLDLLWRLKGPDHLCLVTDATAALGAPADRARLGDQPLLVDAGAVRLVDGTLAGSSLTMDRAVAALVRFSGASLAQAVAAASLNPGRLLGLEEQQWADVVLLDRQLAVKGVLVGGKRVFGRTDSHHGTPG